MTPTSLLAGVLTGLGEGFGVALLVFLVITVIARRHRPSVVPHPVAEDRPATGSSAYVPHERDRLHV